MDPGEGDKGQPCVYASVFLFARLYKLGGDWRGSRLILSTRTWLHSSLRQTLVLQAAVCPRELLTRLFVLLCAQKVGMGWLIGGRVSSQGLWSWQCHLA